MRIETPLPEKCRESSLSGSFHLCFATPQFQVISLPWQARSYKSLLKMELGRESNADGHNPVDS
jgi:hypothetical protein